MMWKRIKTFEDNLNRVNRNVYPRMINEPSSVILNFNEYNLCKKNKISYDEFVWLYYGTDCKGNDEDLEVKKRKRDAEKQKRYRERKRIRAVAAKTEAS